MNQPKVSVLEDMLAGMQPKLDERPFEFLESTGDDQAIFALIHEDEGTTYVVASQGPGKVGQFARITLAVFSDLEGVGLTAAVSRALADAGIACNVIAAFHHDHLFVTWERREEAMQILQSLSRKAQASA